jgi:ribonuclease D
VIPSLSPARYIDTQHALDDLVESLTYEPQIAVDTESNNMHVYRGQVSLVQLSTRAQDYIIDPIAIDDLQGIGDVLADARIEKIFHAAEYDLICMKRDFGFEVQNLFDTMYAARLCHAEAFGLADLLRNYFNVEVDKSHQLDDWGQRPLPADSLRYAQMDTHYLPHLRDVLLDELITRGGLREAQEVFADVLRIEVKDNSFDPDDFWKLGIPRSFNRRQMALLREVFIVRDDIARDQDRPHFKIMSNKTLIKLVRERPRNHTQLFKLRGLSPAIVRMYGEEIIEAVERGLQAKPPKMPPRDNPPADLTERYMALHAWRKERAIQRGIDSDLILAKQTLWEIAREMPDDSDQLAQIEGIGVWRMETYGDELLALVDDLR